MKTVTWLPFCVSSPTTRTGVHFFPSADNVTAPYPANCTLTLFGGSAQMRSVVLEGGRLSNPDGVRLEDAFPELKNDLQGMFGLAVEISSTQPRLNLSGSGCIIELNSRGYPSRYWPAMINIPEPGRESPRPGAARNAVRPPEGALVPGAAPRTGIALHDGAHHTSVVIINGSEFPAKIYNESSSQAVPEVSGSQAQKMLLSDAAPRSVLEVPLAESFFDNALSQECSWGRLKARAVTLSIEPVLAEASQKERDALNSAVVSYMLYRDANSRRIVSVNSM